MNLASARKHLAQALKPHFSYCNFSSSNSVGVSLKAFKYSTSCQPSLEVGDNSAGEVHEESQMQQTSLVKEHIERPSEYLISKTQSVPKVQLHSKLDHEDVQGFPLKEVVQSCVKRWFKEHLKNAQKGDSDAQVMVGKMMSHGYGVPKDAHKGAEWIRRAHSRQKHKAGTESSEKKRSDDEDLYFM